MGFYNLKADSGSIVAQADKPGLYPLRVFDPAPDKLLLGEEALHDLLTHILHRYRAYLLLLLGLLYSLVL